MATFARLLEIKRVRERNAAAGVRAARAALVAREREKVEAEAAVVAFREVRVAKEKAMFDAIRGQTVRIEAIEDMKQRVALLREEERTLAAAVESAGKAIEAAREDCAAAERARTEAARAVSKFEEFVAIQDAEARRARAAREDAEVEEVSEAAFAMRSKGVA
jgi:hypothetical protein